MISKWNSIASFVERMVTGESKGGGRKGKAKHNSKYIFSNSSEEEKAQILKVKAIK